MAYFLTGCITTSPSTMLDVHRWNVWTNVGSNMASLGELHQKKPRTTFFMNHQSIDYCTRMYLRTWCYFTTLFHLPWCSHYWSMVFRVCFKPRAYNDIKNGNYEFQYLSLMVFEILPRFKVGSVTNFSAWYCTSHVSKKLREVALKKCCIALSSCSYLKYSTAFWSSIFWA